jgi:hypothetical protein
MNLKSFRKFRKDIKIGGSFMNKLLQVSIGCVLVLSGLLILDEDFRNNIGDELVIVTKDLLSRHANNFAQLERKGNGNRIIRNPDQY